MDDLPSDQQAVKGKSTQANRPRSLWVLIALGVANSLFGLLWPLFLPPLLLIATQPFAATRAAAIIMAIYACSLIDLVVTCGLWMRQQWAFRVGLITTVFTVAIDIFIILVSIAQTALDVGAGLSLVLTSAMLSLFLQPEVIRTVIAWRQRG